MVLSIEVLTLLDKCLIAFDGTFPGEAAVGSEATHAAQLPLGARDDLGEGDALELSRRLGSWTTTSGEAASRSHGGKSRGR